MPERPEGLFRRIVRRLIGSEMHERLRAIERLARKTHEAGQNRADGLSARVTQLTEQVSHQPTAKDLRELRQTVQRLATELDKRTPSAAGPAIHASRSDERQIRKRLDRITSSGRPLLIGPWSGEVGFELLYWIPFIDWVQSQWDVKASRQMIVSRGGVASWYRARDGEYDDIFSYCTPDEFRTAVAADKRKQRRVGSLDQRLIDQVTAARQLENPESLHPSLMYRLFEPFWRDEAGYARIDQFTRYRLFDPPASDVSGLPSEYVAVRFYFGESFPETPDNRTFANTVVASLAERTPVVLLNPGFSVDEHFDWGTDARGRIHTIADRVIPASNLAVQSAVLAGARAFVGNYGGYSYLAPLLGVPAVAFYSRPLFERHHLYAAERAFERIGAATLTPVNVAQARLVQSALWMDNAQCSMPNAQ